MNHFGTKEIETDRLLLRRFVNEDAKAMYDNWASDDQVTKYLTWPSHTDVSMTQSSVKNWVEGYEDASQYKWAITLKDNPGEVIGDISVVAISEHRQECEIGYVLGHKFWSQGYMSEAMKAVSHYLLIEADFNRVEALHDVANPASGKVMQKAGLQYEGTHRQYSLNNTGLVDSARYAIIKEDLIKEFTKK